MDYKQELNSLLNECQSLNKSIDIYKQSLDFANKERDIALSKLKFWKETAKKAQEDERILRESVEELIFLLNHSYKNHDFKISSVTLVGNTVVTLTENISCNKKTEEDKDDD